MLKNLGRFKQWTGERLGGTKAILQTEDIQQLENQTEQWHEGFEKMYRGVKKAYAELAHRKQTTTAQETTVKARPLHAIGESWIRHGKEIADSSPKLGDALKRLGEAEIEISTQMEAVAVELNDNYLQLLRDSRKCYDEYREIRKKLEMRRLDYAANLGRLQKAKKEKPQLEQILQQSRIKYEETENDLLQHMMQLDDYKDDHRKALKDFLDVQLNSYMTAVSILKNIQSSWPDGLEEEEEQNEEEEEKCDDNDDSTTPIAKKRVSSDSAYERSSTTSAKLASTTSRGPERPLEPISDTVLNSVYSSPSIVNHYADQKSSSTSDYSADCNSLHSNYSERTAEFKRKPSTAMSLHSTRRKAIYDFKGEHPEDLSFRTGDIITVVEEINQGWWLGEVGSKGGEKVTGIFPVNYTEAFDTNESPPPLPAKDSHLLQEASIRQHARSNSKH